MSSSFHTLPPGWLGDAMRKAMQDEAQRIVTEESDAAQRRVAERLSGMVDNLALSALSHYRIEYRANELIIRVDKRALTPPAG
ncbi:hypothetical protein [uncultured Sphingobium sp.]|uniref:hypothetical protein n=1 Tax=uncultured Sphingobium sp. TaxID=316087 RepID=UPI00259B5A56|nr:hypothetical protein [uncultured Sphingobium sp.]